MNHELRTAHARSFECACAGFCASVLLTASSDFAPGPCSELRNPCAGENYFIIDRCLRARSFSGKTESTKTHTYAAGEGTGDSSSLASSAFSLTESWLGRRRTASGGDAASRGPNLDRTASSTSSDVRSNCRASSSKPPAAKRAAPTDRGPRGARSARWSATCA